MGCAVVEGTGDVWADGVFWGVLEEEFVDLGADVVGEVKEGKGSARGWMWWLVLFICHVCGKYLLGGGRVLRRFIRLRCLVCVMKGCICYETRVMFEGS